MRGKQEVVELSNKRGYLLAESVSERSSSLRRKILEVLQLQLQRSTPVSIKMLSQEIVRSDTNRYSENWDCTELKETLDSLVQNREIFSHLSGWVLELPHHPHGHIKLLVKYEQSGKTRIVLNAVQAHSGGQNVLNIIFCDNSLLLTTATTLRAGSHSDLVKEGSINLSSDPKHHQWKDITEDALDGGADTSARKTCVQAIREGDVNTIICCGHKRRFEDIQDLIELLSSDGFLFNIHVDEADKVLRPGMLTRRLCRLSLSERHHSSLIRAGIGRSCRGSEMILVQHLLSLSKMKCSEKAIISFPNRNLCPS